MLGLNTPRLRRTGQNTQITYDLSRRLNDVQPYPIQSPQGANIFIYAHDSGVTLVWRGGKRFKATQPAPLNEKPNGSSEDAVMVIDSDDDQPATKAEAKIKFEDKPEFEDQVEETPYPEVVQTLDLVLGAAVLDVAVMPLSPKSAQDTANGRAAILGHKIVFAVSCVTNDIYLITLPLTPPSPAAKARPELRNSLFASKAGTGAWGESITLLSGQSKPSDGLAIGLVPSGLSDRATSINRVVVASHSREASGVLRLWETALDQKLKLEASVEPFQTEFLPSPLRSVSFNPSHSTQLLTVTPSHGVRIYDYALPSLPPDPEATGPFPPQGSWLVTLYQPFIRPSSLRKPIVDAAWIAHGKAVFALLADGMWGIWDIDGADPASSASAISTKLQSGVRGAALTAFSVSGYVEGTSSLRSVASQHKETNTGEFAPMTPHSRRQATSNLGLATTPDRLSTIHGGVKVLPLPAPGQALLDESLALWLGGQDHVCVIPQVLRFWETQARKASSGGNGLFTGTHSSRLIKIQELSTSLLGERCCGVTLLTDISKKTDDAESGEQSPVDVLIRGETRLIVVRDVQASSSGTLGGPITKGKRLFSKADQPSAIIVHGSARPSTVTFNLSRAKPGSLRFNPSFANEEGNYDDDSMADANETKSLPQPGAGFDFMNTLNDAADTTTDLNRDVEVEMLDIMGIDKALENLDGSRGVGRKKVLFGED
ncbi:hypothetical protein V2G26_017506 [Clonostachys chloroleuca]